MHFAYDTGRRRFACMIDSAGIWWHHISHLLVLSNKRFENASDRLRVYKLTRQVLCMFARPGSLVAVATPCLLCTKPPGYEELT